MKIEVGKTYRVTGGTMNGATVKIIDADKKHSPMSYRYVRVDGTNQFSSWFHAGSPFAGWLRPVDPEMKIVVLRDGNKVTATGYRDGEKITTGVAKCSPEDIFNFATGARIAFDRLMIKDSSSSAADDSKSVVSLSMWTRFELGKMAVQVNRETIDDFLKECEERGYTWQCGDKATERNPFRDYDGLSPVGVTVFQILKMVPKDSIWIRMHEGKLAMDIDEKPDDVEVYEW